MNRRTARTIHNLTNLAYWVENPEWLANVAALRLARGALDRLHVSPYGIMKHAFFREDGLIAINGESVVVANGPDAVDKYMFRYPGAMELQVFKDHVAREVGAVTSSLAGIALPTEVSIKTANIFKRDLGRTVLAVVQSQPRLDLVRNPALDMAQVEADEQTALRDQTARDLEQMLRGIQHLESEGLYPDIANSSGNLRRSTAGGQVTLVDVMPIHADGSRLIGDKPPGLLEHTLGNILVYQEFVGQYGR